MVDNTKNGEEDDSNIDKEIKRWGECRGKTKSIRTLTVTMAYNTIAKDDPEFDIQSYISRSSRCLSILGVDVTLLANFICSQDHLVDSLESDVCSYRFYRSCYDVCVGIDNNIDNGVKNAFREFVEKTGYKVRSDLKSDYELCRRCRDAVIQYEIIPSMKQHIKYLVSTTIIEYLTLCVGKTLWQYRYKSEFKDSIEFLARKLKDHLICGTSLKDKAVPALHKVLKDWSSEPNEGILMDFNNIVKEFTPYIEEIRRVGRDNPPKVSTKKPESSDDKPKKQKKLRPYNPVSHHFHRGVLFAKSIVLKMAKRIGDKIETVRIEKIKACKTVTEQQPWVRKSDFWEGVTKFHSGYKRFLDSNPDILINDVACLNKWYQSPSEFKGKLTQEEYDAVKNLHRKINEYRQDLFSKQPDNPGHMFVGTSFTLLPIRSLNFDFINIDHDVLTTWRLDAFKKLNKKKIDVLHERNWWFTCFNPYRKDVVERKHIKERKKVNQFKFIKRRNKKTVQIRFLNKSKSIMLNDELYNQALQDPTIPVPFFISNIRTDGVQVKLLLKTLADHHPTARHVDLLVKKGYEEIKNTTDAKLDIFKDNRGVFDESRVKCISQDKQKILEKHQKDIKIEFSTVDPGLDKFVSWYKSNLLANPLHFHHTPSSFGAMKSTYYRVLNLSKNSCKVEEQRRRDNIDYKTAINDLSQERLNHDSTSLREYLYVRHRHTTTLESELLSADRNRLRFIRFRAQQRAIRYLARQIVGRNMNVAESKAEKRMKNKAEMVPDQEGEIRERLQLRENLREKLNNKLRIRIVIFGKGQFGHGRVGPCPRKALIKKLAELTTVILIDEFRTSKKCCGGCGNDAIQLKGSRVLRCQSGKPLEGVIPESSSAVSESSSLCELWNKEGNCAFEIDRDQNACVNMFRIGQNLLLGKSRPAYMTRPNSSTDEDEIHI